VRAAAFSPDGKWIATASEDKTAVIWNRENLYDTTTIRHPNFVMNVTFSPDSKFVLTACKDGIARLYKMGSWKEPAAELSGHQKSIRSVAFSPDGNLIVTGSEDSTASVWQRTAEGKWEPKTKLGESAANTGSTAPAVAKPSSGHTNFVQTAAFSHDGKFIVTASRDNTTKIWQVDQGMMLQTLQDENVVRDAVFGTADQVIVTGNESCQIKVWQRTGKTWGRLSGGKWTPDQTLPALGCGEKSDDYQHGYIDSVNFDPTGQFLLSASRDRRVFVRETQTWRKLGEALVGHQGEVYCAEYSPDGTYAISASEDGKVILWEPRAATVAANNSVDQLLEIARLRLFRRLDCNELRRFQLPCETSTTEECC
jgi:WD40 repeat protein